MLFAFDPGTWTLPAIVAAATVVLLARLKVRRRAGLPEAKRETSPNSTPAHVMQARVIGTDVRATERQLVDYYEFAREIEARLDAKRALLEQAVREADERLARLAEAEAERPRQNS